MQYAQYVLKPKMTFPKVLDVQTTVNVLNTVSHELNNTVEVLNNTNTTVGDIGVIVQANVDATNAIANTLVSINNKLDKLTRRINMGV